MSGTACKQCKALVDEDDMYEHLNWHTTLDQRFTTAVRVAVKGADEQVSETIETAARSRSHRVRKQASS